MQEEWKIIKNYSKYSCSKLGKIRNEHTKRILNPKISNIGYLTVTLKNEMVKKFIQVFID